MRTHIASYSHILYNSVSGKFSRKLGQTPLVCVGIWVTSGEIPGDVVYNRIQKQTRPSFSYSPMEDASLLDFPESLFGKPIWVRCLEARYPNLLLVLKGIPEEHHPVWGTPVNQPGILLNPGFKKPRCLSSRTFVTVCVWTIVANRPLGYNLLASPTRRHMVRAGVTGVVVPFRFFFVFFPPAARLPALSDELLGSGRASSRGREPQRRGAEALRRPEAQPGAAAEELPQELRDRGLRATGGKKTRRNGSIPPRPFFFFCFSWSRVERGGKVFVFVCLLLSVFLELNVFFVVLSGGTCPKVVFTFGFPLKPPITRGWRFCCLKPSF